VESCTPQQAEKYCRPNAQGGPPPKYGGQQWKLVDKQTKCMPPFGHYGHLGQWTRGQSNCPPPPHGHYKHQGQWAVGYQGHSGITIVKGWQQTTTAMQIGWA
jgi:hypothetical protein